LDIRAGVIDRYTRIVQYLIALAHWIRFRLGATLRTRNVAR